MSGLPGWVPEEDRAEWDEFVAYQRENTVETMLSSAYVMSLVPDAARVDVKFAVELGFALMLGKPLILVAVPGVRIPFRLRKAADAVITADLDTEAGRESFARQLEAATRRMR